MLIPSRYRLAAWFAITAVCLCLAGLQLSGCDANGKFDWGGDAATGPADDEAIAGAVRDIGSLFGPLGIAAGTGIAAIVVGIRRTARSVKAAREEAAAEQRRIDAAWDEATSATDARTASAVARADAAFDEGAARAVVGLASSGVPAVSGGVPGAVPAPQGNAGAVA